VHTPHY